MWSDGVPSIRSLLLRDVNFFRSVYKIILLRIETQSSLRTPTILKHENSAQRNATLEEDEGANEQYAPNETSRIWSGFSE